MNKEIILSCLAKTLEKDIEEIKALPEDAVLNEIGLDSIKFISFIVELENALEFEVLDSDLLMENFETLAKSYITLEKYFEVFTVKKCLVLDCDGILWKGIAGEEEIIIDIQIIEFQKELINLYEQGVLLCLCSKNEPENIAEVFRRPDMILSREWHIIIEKFGVKNKAESIKEIAAELNLSADSFVFIDDDNYETGLVNAFMSEVETVSTPQDLNRTQLYREQKERTKAAALFDSVEEYNNSLETKIICGIADENQVGRITELSQRTNQFNLANRHYSQNETEYFLREKAYTVLFLSVSDKYGDMGVVAAAVVQELSNCAVAVIENFMLSCRVFGRGFENVMLNKIREIFSGLSVSGVFVLTGKNKKHSNFYTENGVSLWQN